MLVRGEEILISLDAYKKKQLVFLFTNEGEKVSFKNDNIIVKDRDGVIKHQSTCWRIAALFVVGGLTMTSGLIERAHKFCFPIFMMKSSFRTYDVIGFKAEGNTFLKRQQYAYSGLDIGKHIVSNKILNQRAMLMKLRVRSDEANQVISDLKSYASMVYEANTLNELMGYEGSASRAYFSQYFNNVEWSGRQPKAKRDFVNATLDIGYSMLFNFIESLLCYFGFDLYVGVLHTEFHQRKSLVCDLVEPFRPLIDNCIRTSISLGKCREEDFIYQKNMYMLDWKQSKEYLMFLLNPILVNKDDMFRYIRDYYRAFSRQRPENEFPVFKV